MPVYIPRDLLITTDTFRKDLLDLIIKNVSLSKNIQLTKLDLYGYIHGYITICNKDLLFTIESLYYESLSFVFNSDVQQLLEIIISVHGDIIKNITIQKYLTINTIIPIKILGSSLIINNKDCVLLNNILQIRNESVLEYIKTITS